MKRSIQDRIDVVQLYKDRLENLKNTITNESDLQKAALFVIKDTYRHDKTFTEYLESLGYHESKNNYTDDPRNTKRCRSLGNQSNR